MLALTERVLDVVSAYIAREGLNMRPGPSDRLRDCGLTSLQLVSLIFELEREFDTSIPDHLIHPNNFVSVEAITCMLGMLKPEWLAE